MSDQANTDRQLLREFIEHRSEPAFAELVRRHVDWIYAAARRQAGERAADDLTQAVFMVLLKKAHVAVRQPVLSAWLFRVLHYAVLRSQRDQVRRLQHERQAAEQASEKSPPNFDRELLSMVDELLASLREKDRRAIIVRFYEQRGLNDVGQSLGISEEAARKRVDRALHKLRLLFARRGITGSAEILSAFFVEQNLIHVPSATAQNIVRMKITSTAMQFSKGAIRMIFRQKFKSVLTAVAGLMVITAAGWGGIALSQTGHKPTPGANPISPPSVVAPFPNGVTPFVSSQGVFVAVSQDGLHVSGYSSGLGKWTPLKLEDDALSELKFEKQPGGTMGKIITSPNIAALRIGTHLYAYSPITGTWDELIVDNLPSLQVDTEQDEAIWNYGNQLAIFSAHSGKWATVNWGK